MKRLVSSCLLLAFGFGLGLLSSEILVRALFPVSDFFWQWDPVIGMKLVPGKHGRSVKQGVYDVRVDVNSAGFRDREHAIKKPSGVYRVVLLGDSQVEALQVPFEQTITSVLEDRLEKERIPSEVINFGVSGAGTAREYLALREYGLKYKPDLVLLFFVGNDFGDNTRQLKGLSYIPYPKTSEDGSLVLDGTEHPTFNAFADQTSRLSPLTSVLRDHSKGYHLIRDTIDALPPLGDIWSGLRPKSAILAASDQSVGSDFGLYEIYRTTPKPAWAKGWRVTEELLLAVRNLAKESGVPFGVVVVPAAWEVYPQRWAEVLSQVPAMREAPLDVDLPNRNLVRFLNEHDVHTIDLLNDFRARATKDPFLYLRGDGHWTAAGHRLAADLVNEQIAKTFRSESN